MVRSPNKIRVLAFFRLNEVRYLLSDQDRARIEERHGVKVDAVEDEAGLARALPEADVFVGWQFPRQYFGAAERLLWIHSASAGVEATLFPEVVGSEVIVTNSTGLHSICIPEHVLGQMLILARNFHEALRLQSRAEWNRFQVIGHGASIRELHGGRLAILGAGPIGRNLARLAGALGMRVRVMRRDASRGLPEVEAVVPPEGLRELLGWADWVVCVLPLTPETRGLIGADALGAMRSDAYLINVGRGETVDEEALVRALRSGAIAGAALDVFTEEPLPAEHPFWSLPNLVLTPHISGYMPNYFEKALALFEDNLDRFLHGRPLRNVVDKRLGYAVDE